jgi:hypothetical protein
MPADPQAPKATPFAEVLRRAGTAFDSWANVADLFDRAGDAGQHSSDAAVLRALAAREATVVQLVAKAEDALDEALDVRMDLNERIVRALAALPTSYRGEER